MTPNKKLFRAIVILGAAMTASACKDEDCHACAPHPDAYVSNDANATDAGPGDAPVDTFIAII